jgi:hypothetical protein
MSTSVCKNIEVIFHGQKVEVVLNFLKLDVIFHVQKTLRLPLICPNIQVIFHKPRYWGRLPFPKKVIFHLPKYWSCLPFAKFWNCLPFSKILRSSSIWKHEVVFHFPKYWGLLPFVKILRFSSNCKNIKGVLHLKKIEVVFHLRKKLRSSSIWEKNWGLLPNGVSSNSRTSFTKQVLRAYAVILTKNSYLDTPTAGWMAGRPAGWSARRLTVILRLTKPS